MKKSPPASSALCLILCLILGACAGKESPSSGPYAGPPCMDVLTLPQDLTVYAAAGGGSRPLVDAGSRQASAARQKEAFYRPWRLTKPARWIQQSLNRNFDTSADNAYTDDKRPFPRSVWDGLVANSNKKAYGRNSGPAITLSHGNLRAMPGVMRLYRNPDRPGEGYPFDHLQHSAIAPGSPLYICNVSRDGLWLLVDGPATAGWLPAADVARVDASFMERWQSRPLAALARDNVFLDNARGGIGTLLPLAAATGPGLDQAVTVFIPRAGASGLAEIAAISLPSGSATLVPLPLSADNIARVGNAMMGQPYTWGALGKGRDCSALTGDLFAPFGIRLPRNSSRQAGVGRVIDLAGMGPGEKEAAIARSAAPFRSLIWLKGHIGLYLGTYEGKAVMFHNMWGLRIKDASGACDGRAVVGKAVVTTLRAGVERPDICHPNGFLDRIEKIIVLPD